METMHYSGQALKHGYISHLGNISEGVEEEMLKFLFEVFLQTNSELSHVMECAGCFSRCTELPQLM